MSKKIHLFCPSPIFTQIIPMIENSLMLSLVLLSKSAFTFIPQSYFSFRNSQLHKAPSDFQWNQTIMTTFLIETCDTRHIINA